MPVSNSSQKIRLGIWGPPNSGKTVYMTMLYYYYSIKKVPSSKWRIVINDQDTDNFITEKLRLINDERKFVPSTKKNVRNGRGEYKVYSYNLINDSDKENIELKFFDLPGEFYVDPSGNRIVDENNTELSIVQYLTQCHGILFLMSPLKEDSGQNSYFRLLSDLLRGMQRENNNLQKLEQYIAFGITKADHEEVYNKFSGTRYAEKSMLEILGGNIGLNWLETFFHVQIDPRRQILYEQPSEYHRCRAFYISCFGVYKDNGKFVSPVLLEKSKGEDENSNSEPSQSPNPIFESTSNTNDLYDELLGGIESYDNPPEPSISKIYVIDEKAPFNAINVISPIDWMLKGIKQCPPQLSPLNRVSSEDSPKSGDGGEL
jgi:GTPase SAR1 family protein